jgi:putative endonuclease
MHRQDRPPEQAWYVYLLECADTTLYCGITRDPAARLAQHNGTLPGGARYTAGRRPVRLLARRACANKSEALKLERAVKARPRAEKLSLLLTG